MNASLTPSFAALSLLLACAPAYTASPAMAQMGVLTNPAGMTLYVFDKDVAGDGVNKVWHIARDPVAYGVAVAAGASASAIAIA